MTRGSRTKVDELKDALKKRKSAEMHANKQPVKASKDSHEQKSNEALEKRVETVEKEAKDHYDKLLKVMAEFENFK